MLELRLALEMGQENRKVMSKKPEARKFVITMFFAIILCTGITRADKFPEIRVGVLQFGTVNWELETIRRYELDRKNNISLKIVPLGSKNATHVAIQGGAVDVIVSDWVWVSRQRYLGRDYTFAPYSTATGSVLVNPDSGITSLSELKGKRIGIAGGPVDKSWILLNAFARIKLDTDLQQIVEPVFAAPPLLNELFVRNEFDAVLNFWHYTARLEAEGALTLLRIADILPALGIDRPLPMIGWVFSENWANQNRKAIDRFLAASTEAKKLLLENNDVWLDLRPIMNVENERLAVLLRDAFRQGIPDCFNEQDIEYMRQAFLILARYGGTDLVGESPGLVEGTVWNGFGQSGCR